MKVKKLLFAALALAAAVLFSGCMTKSADELYALPQLSSEYVQLQDLINDILSEGAEGTVRSKAPTSGSYRQAVQFQDLDGDGEKEVVAFFGVQGDDRPLKVYLFETHDDIYSEAAIIEGTGTDVRSIDYADMDGDGVSEVIIGWQVTSGMSMLSGYSIKDYQVVQIFSGDYTSYAVCSMTPNAGADILTITGPTPDAPAGATLYSLGEKLEVTTSSARLSNGITNLLSMKTGMLSDGSTGAFVESSIDEASVITDVLAYKKNALSNVSMRSSSGVSQGTVRTYSIYSADIDADGVMEIPNPIQLYSQSENVNYWMIEWYSIDAEGTKTVKETTYHNLSDGWYLVLPDDWRENITVHRGSQTSGERSLTFSYLSGEEGELTDFLTIFALSGTNRDERASINGRIPITEKNNTVFAYELKTDADIPLSISDELIKTGFHIIYAEINT